MTHQFPTAIARLGAVEAGGTKFVVAVGTASGDILAEERIATTTPDETIPAVVDFFAAHGNLEAIGIGCFGPIDLNPTSRRFGFIRSTPKAGWRNVDVVGPIRQRLGIPVAFDTDVNAAALAEAYWGGARELRTFMYVTVGTGIGGGIMVDGVPLHGMMHPEIGHIRVPQDRSRDPFDGICPYHGACLEGLASGPAIAARWGASPERLPREHPAWALEADYLAVACANWACSFSPERILMGGGVMQPQLFPLIRERAIALLNGYLDVPAVIEHIQEYIAPSPLAGRAGVLGALALAAREVSISPRTAGAPQLSAIKQPGLASVVQPIRAIVRRIPGIRSARGALVIDIDWTLLANHKEPAKRQTLGNSPLARLLVSVFRCLSHLCVISGNDLDEQRRRFSDPLAAMLANAGAPAEIAKLVVFANGAACKYGFTESGDAEADETYNSRTPLGVDAIRRACELGERVLADSRERFADASFQERFPGFQPRWHRVQLRGEHQIVLQDLPGSRFAANKTDSEQIRAVGWLNGEFQKSDETRDCVAKLGGEVTVDIVKRGVDKKLALTNLIETLALDAESVIYVGDEFYYVDEWVHGIDSVVASVPGVLKLSVDLEARRPQLPHGVHWIGERMIGTNVLLEMLHEFL